MRRCCGRDDEAAGYRAAGAAMTAAVDKAGWDGAWFRRAYDNFSRPIGSHWNEEGQIFIEPQGMCVMAGIGVEDGRARQALDSVAERLATPHGIVLQQPAYSQYYLHLGEISTYPPGYKENAGIFCHTNPWIMIAEAKLGNGDAAHDYYLRINPSAREAIGEIHRCEPYVYSQMIAGRDAPTHGEAKNSWLSGTAAWNYVAITQWILGIRPEHAGLRDRARHSGELARLQRDAGLPRRDVPDQCRAAGAGERRRAHGRRAGGGRRRRAVCRAGRRGAGASCHKVGVLDRRGRRVWTAKPRVFGPRRREGDRRTRSTKDAKLRGLRASRPSQPSRLRGPDPVVQTFTLPVQILSKDAAMGSSYGYYDAAAREYVITRPDTPTPWLNYLGQGGYGGIISNTAGGYSFDRDPRNRRVTRYRYNSIPADQPGRYIYLRDQETGAYWSPTWQPVTQVQLEGYECRHGAGYTRIRSRYAGIGAELLYFVPPDQPPGAACELWVLRVRNLSDEPRHIGAFSYAEFCYWDAITDQQNLDWGQQIMFSEAGPCYVSTGVIFRPTRSFLGCSRPYDGFETDRETFMGRCRSLANPQAVELGDVDDGLAPRGNNIGCLFHELTLQPGEVQELVYVLGDHRRRGAHPRGRRAVSPITCGRDEAYRACRLTGTRTWTHSRWNCPTPRCRRW